MSIETIAHVCHDANRALQLEYGDPAPSPLWEDAPEWQRESAISGVRAALAGTTPEELHEAWCSDKVAAGWTYGEVKDSEAETHPCLVDYDALPADQQAKDGLFVGIVDALGEVAEQPLDLDGRHSGVVDLLQFFDAGHLPEHLAAVSSVCRITARTLVRALPDGPELTAGLRKLLEAKDCFVRAAL